MTEIPESTTNEAPPTPAEQESGLVRHARIELEKIGEESWIIEHYLTMVRIFSEMGHSGGSAPIFIETLRELLYFNNLSPLTDDPEEWQHIGESQWGSPEGVWQNRRRGEAFSNDGGKTYYLLSEGGHDRNRQPLHESVHFERKKE